MHPSSDHSYVLSTHACLLSLAPYQMSEHEHKQEKQEAGEKKKMPCMIQQSYTITQEKQFTQTGHYERTNDAASFLRGTGT